MRTSFCIAALLLVIGCVASYVILSWDSVAFPVASKALSIISLWACVAAFISAMFVIQSYLETNRAFVSSQKPHLRIWVDNLKKLEQDQTQIHITRINYENMTLNPFFDLTIRVKVSNSKTTADLSDLFTPKMFMAGRDQRQRNFSTRPELLSHAFEIESESTPKDLPRLSISYDFTFNRNVEQVIVQQYIWNTEHKHWAIA